MTSAILYIVNGESEIPANPSINTAYYVVGKEIKLIDSLGQTIRFVPEMKKKDGDSIDERLAKCEKSIGKIETYLSGFKVGE